MPDWLSIDNVRSFAGPSPFSSPAGVGLDGLAIPLRIVEMLVGSHEVIDREIILAVEEPRPAADELLGRLAKMPPQPQSGSKTKRRT
jgi:hypothetical protein